MNTFLLYWNPFFSSYKLERFLDEFDFPEGVDVLTDLDEWDRSPNDFDWSIVEHEKAHAGDRFVFIKVGYEKPIGIVGVGHVGSLVAKMAERKGMEVLLNDPPKNIGVSLDFIAQNSDIITFHVPLDKSTYHMCDEAFLAK